MIRSPLVYDIAPTRADVPGPRPLLILLHGRGTDERDLLELAPYFPPDFLIVSVRAPFQFPYGGYTWFGMEEMENPDIEQLTESRKLLTESLEEIQKVQSADPDNIFLFGFSMGAMMALEVVLWEPVNIKGVVAHSGCIFQSTRFPDQLGQVNAPTIFVAHGTYDPIVPVELARKSYELLLQAGIRIQYREYPIQHTISDDSLRDTSLWLQNQLRHKS